MSATAVQRVTGPLPWVAGLETHGTRTALVTSGRTMSYAELSSRVASLADRLGGDRRLVLLEGAPTPETVIGYLAAQAAGHVVLLTQGRAHQADGLPAPDLRTQYPPDIVLGSDGEVSVLRERSAYDLHDDLALLLSTSGSTGSAKLVRLSANNLAVNARQIGSVLDIRRDDCAAMTLPLTYCYGLSVLHTHLAAGAGVLLTDRSVVDECFWRLFEHAGATTFPAVPHTFELLERSGFAERDLPHLRYVTQAGGRMDPDRVRHWARVGRRRGWDLHVMYGQCEATARMAHLPPDLAEAHPDSVGLAVPDASLTIEDGEIVFRGDNVMLGYANRPEDLALGRTVDALRTGDLGHLGDDGLLHVVGRRSRFVKVLGHRVDLDAVEARLRAAGHDVRCSGRDGLVVASVVDLGPGRPSLPPASLARAAGTPPGAVQVVPVSEHPMLTSGKPDHPAILRLAESASSPAAPVAPVAPSDRAAASDALETAGSRLTSVAELYAALLNRAHVAPTESFVTLGGDSLSYVEVSVRLEQLLGDLPAGWHAMPVGDLEHIADDRRHALLPSGATAPATETTAAARPSPRGGRRVVESITWLRALAIVLIVGTHADLFSLQGSANALLVIAGYQMARLQLGVPGRGARAVRALRAVRRIVAPTLVVIATAHLVGGYYEPRNLVLANWIFGEQQLGPAWRFWFIEALVVALVGTTALVSIPAIHRLERRRPFAFPLALTIVAVLALRVPVLPLPVPRMDGSPLVVLYLFLFGWAMARATTQRHRLLLTGLAVVLIGTFSFNPARDGVTLAMVLVLLWLPRTRLPGAVVPAIRALAAASLFIYVIHWQALELLWGSPVAAFSGSLAAGLAYWWVWTRCVAPAAHAIRGRLEGALVPAVSVRSRRVDVEEPAAAVERLLR